MNASDPLVDMANDISSYFETDPQRDAGVAGMVQHQQKFWEPRMRKKIVNIARSDASGLSPLAHEAVIELATRIDPHSGNMKTT